MLKNALADVAGEKWLILARRRDGSEEGKIGGSEILRFVDDYMIEWLAVASAVVGELNPRGSPPPVFVECKS